MHTGVTRQVFFEMLDILTKEFNKIHKNGHFKGIGPGCKLVIALTYWREYRAMRQMGLDYDVALSTVSDSVRWVEDILFNAGFCIQDIKTELKNLEEENVKVECIIGDVEEQRIERPTINQEDNYSGKKKDHTEKNQILIDEKSEKILNYYCSKGTVHDYQMLKNSDVLPFLEERKISGKFDSGYQGVQKELTNAVIPFKKSKNHELTEEEKEHNKKLSKERIKVEHVNRKIKIFRIAKERYRNHQNRYELRMNIMCSIYNRNIG